MTIRSRMSSIIGQSDQNDWSYLPLRKIAEFHFVYTLASKIINQSAQNLVKIYMTIRSWMSSIMALIG